MLESRMLFIISALGLCTGLLLSLYFLLRARPRHASNYFLALFFFSLCFRTANPAIFFFNAMVAYDQLQVGLMFSCLVGPALYLYCRSVSKSFGEKDRSWMGHLGLIVPVVVIGGLLFPFSEHLSLWSTFIFKGIYALWMIYSILALIRAWPIMKKVILKSPKVSNLDRWVVGLLVGNAVILLTYIYIGITDDILGVVLSSFLVYSAFRVLFKNTKRDPVILRPQAQVDEVNKVPRPDETEHRESTVILQRIEQLVEEESLYLDPNLRIMEVADRLRISPRDISKAVDQVHDGQDFHHFLDVCRVEHAKRLISGSSSITIMAVGHESGFHSKSSFLSTFKSIAGRTPSQYKAEVLRGGEG